MPFGTRQECKKNLLSWPLHFRKCSKETNINVNDLPKCKFKNNYKVCGVSQRSATTAFVSISKKNTSCKSDIFRNKWNNDHSFGETQLSTSRYRESTTLIFAQYFPCLF
jgi:hypothetical protein